MPTPTARPRLSAADVESMLGLCMARRTCRTQMLRWHYRSRHQSLIAVSNREFYEADCSSSPAPSRRRATAGLSFT